MNDDEEEEKGEEQRAQANNIFVERVGGKRWKARKRLAVVTLNACDTIAPNFAPLEDRRRETPLAGGNGSNKKGYRCLIKIQQTLKLMNILFENRNL